MIIIIFHIPWKKAGGSWEEFVDDSTSEKYYFNCNTKETLWEAEYLCAR
jgi:hypothetical protein